MKWVLLGKRHINTNNICSFFWDIGFIYIEFVNKDGKSIFPDPDKKLYLQLCKQQGIRPYEEECGWQN